MSLLLVIFFGILYVIASTLMQYAGITSLYFHIALAFFFVLLQYLIGPFIVDMAMRIKYVKREDLPWLFEMVEDLAQKAKIPIPRVGISYIGVPNAFAFGRSLRDGRVCVTKAILEQLNREELKAVLGHEISHLKNRDVLFITFLSVIPMILYRLFIHFTFYGSYSRRREGSGYTALIGLLAFVFYFITNLLVLYASRIREYFADRGSVVLGNNPSSLASALYKLVYGAAKTPREELAEVEGLKAFFLNDVSKSRSEIRELAELDLDRSGTIDPYELKSLQGKGVRLTLTDKSMELLSTHPNMLKRIKQLSEYSRF
jgi:heat shock protein HtpX